MELCLSHCCPFTLPPRLLSWESWPVFLPFSSSLSPSYIEDSLYYQLPSRLMHLNSSAFLTLYPFPCLQWTVTPPPQKASLTSSVKLLGKAASFSSQLREFQVNIYGDAGSPLPSCEALSSRSVFCPLLCLVSSEGTGFFQGRL